MILIRLALLSFSDGRQRVHEALKADILAHQARIQEIAEQTGEIKILTGQEVICSTDLARQEAMRVDSLHPDGVIFNIPVFAFPNLSVIAASLLRAPFLLFGPQDPRYPGLGGLLGAAGALSQVGIAHERIWADLHDPTLPGQLLQFGRASKAATRLRGQVYGLIGGRSIGMYTGTSPAEVWTRTFGVDVDHVDQSEILRRAQYISEADATAARVWLESHVQEICYDGVQLTPEKLDFQIRCWLAVQEIIEQFSFDFIGLKCHYDMSEFYSTQCLAAAFVNDPYDWRGPKNPVPLSCEADSDGALTMQIMRLITNRPTSLLDLRFYDRKNNVLVMPNCGAAATWYAARSSSPEENLARVRLVPSIVKYAGGGAHVEFTYSPGPVTLARLSRSEAGYHLLVTHGETVQHRPTEITGAATNWPHAFVRTDVPVQQFVKHMQANHLHLAAGDCVEELTLFAKMKNIPCTVL
jgi:L-fucose isomerase